MSIRLSSVAAGCAAILLTASVAVAQPRLGPPSGGGGGGGAPQQSPGTSLIAGTNPELTLQMLQSVGFTDLKIYEARSGRKHVSGKLADALVSVIHQNCKDNVCSTLTFLVDFGKQDSVDANYMNAWNSTMLYAKMYREDDGSVGFSMEAIIADVPPQYITRVGQAFAMIFKRVLTWKPGDK